MILQGFSVLKQLAGHGQGILVAKTARVTWMQRSFRTTEGFEQWHVAAKMFAIKRFRQIARARLGKFPGRDVPGKLRVLKHFVGKTQRVHVPTRNIAVELRVREHLNGAGYAPGVPAVDAAVERTASEHVVHVGNARHIDVVQIAMGPEPVNMLLD